MGDGCKGQALPAGLIFNPAGRPVGSFPVEQINGHVCVCVMRARCKPESFYPFCHFMLVVNWFWIYLPQSLPFKVLSISRQLQLYLVPCLLFHSSS
jgi:hypothetical protein